MGASRRPTLGGRVNGDAPAILAEPLVLHDSVDGGEDGEVAAEADVLARMDLGADLAHENVAGPARFAAEHLHAAALTRAVAAVAAATLTFFVGHGLRSRPALEAGHAHNGEVLAVAVLPAVVLPAPLLEDQDLLGLLVTHDLTHDAHSGDQRLADLDPTLGGCEEDLFEGEGRAGLSCELLEAHRVSRAHPILLAARTNDCVVHGNRDRYATRRHLSTRGVPRRCRYRTPASLPIMRRLDAGHCGGCDGRG